MLRAQTLWDELATLTEERIFDRTGIINLGPASSAFLATVEQSAKQFNLNVERLDASGIMQRWPEITVPEDYIGLFEANSGSCIVKRPLRPGSNWQKRQAAPSCSIAP